MKVTLDEITVFPSGNDALAVHAYAARVADDLASHVLGRVARAASRGGPVQHRLAADRPFCYVIGPLVRCY
jgi:hypothetical protein